MGTLHSATQAEGFIHEFEASRDVLQQDASGFLRSSIKRGVLAAGGLILTGFGIKAGMDGDWNGVFEAAVGAGVATGFGTTAVQQLVEYTKSHAAAAVADSSIEQWKYVRDFQ